MSRPTGSDGIGKRKPYVSPALVSARMDMSAIGFRCGKCANRSSIVNSGTIQCQTNKKFYCLAGRPPLD
ncbi:MAG: hypothetical protein RDV41_05170 [Planctomycetota bacterium]|nr:hypothetical protein [Planctomycetota bacterium]